MKNKQKERRKAIRPKSAQNIKWYSVRFYIWAGAGTGKERQGQLICLPVYFHAALKSCRANFCDGKS